MKPFLSALVFAVTVLSMFAAETNTTSPSIAPDSRCFELRTCYVTPGQAGGAECPFPRSHLRAFKKHGMEIVGFWIPTDKEQGAENKLVYMLAHKSREAAKQSWKDFQADPEWQKVRTESEANGKLTEKIESVFMAATDYSPLK